MGLAASSEKTKERERRTQHINALNISSDSVTTTRARQMLASGSETRLSNSELVTAVVSKIVDSAEDSLSLEGHELGAFQLHCLGQVFCDGRCPLRRLAFARSKLAKGVVATKYWAQFTRGLQANRSVRVVSVVDSQWPAGALTDFCTALAERFDDGIREKCAAVESATDDEKESIGDALVGDCDSERVADGGVVATETLDASGAQTSAEPLTVDCSSLFEGSGELTMIVLSGNHLWTDPCPVLSQLTRVKTVKIDEVKWLGDTVPCELIDGFSEERVSFKSVAKRELEKRRAFIEAVAALISQSTRLVRVVIPIANGLLHTKWLPQVAAGSSETVEYKRDDEAFFGIVRAVQRHFSAQIQEYVELIIGTLASDCEADESESASGKQQAADSLLSLLDPNTIELILAFAFDYSYDSYASNMRFSLCLSTGGILRNHWCARSLFLPFLFEVTVKRRVGFNNLQCHVDCLRINALILVRFCVLPMLYYSRSIDTLELEMRMDSATTRTKEAVADCRRLFQRQTRDSGYLVHEYFQCQTTGFHFGRALCFEDLNKWTLGQLTWDQVFGEIDSNLPLFEFMKQLTVQFSKGKEVRYYLVDGTETTKRGSLNVFFRRMKISD